MQALAKKSVFQRLAGGLLRDKPPRNDFSRCCVLSMLEWHSKNCVKKMTMTIVISTSRRNLSFVFLFIDLTTRSLTGVYAEFDEVFEMTDSPIMMKKRSSLDI